MSGSLLLSLATGSVLDGLQPASWRGLKFSVRAGIIHGGRRTAVHEYPYRDDVWVEDLGRGMRRIDLSGFVLGTNWLQAEKAFLAAAEQPGAGSLVHPSLGRLTVTLVDFSVAQDAESGGVVWLTFSFVDTPHATASPVGRPSTTGLLGKLASIADGSALQDLTQQVMAPIQEGQAAVRAALAAAGPFVNLAMQVAGTAHAIVGSVRGLAGNYGRDTGAAGAPLSGLTQLQQGLRGTMLTPQDAAAQISTAVAAAATARQAIATQAAAVSAAAAGLTAGNAGTLATALQALAEGVRAAAPDPADQITLLSQMAAYAPAILPSAAPIGAAMAAMGTLVGATCRRAALSSLSRATSAAAPASATETLRLLRGVTPLFDAGVRDAADAGADASYQALRALRAAVVQDLTTRAATLPTLVTVTEPGTLPALVVAYQLYRDATRAPDLIARTRPVHPGFMPLSFEALSS